MKSDAGIVRCSKYAFAPNVYHYCGPEKQSDLLGYIHGARADNGLVEILSAFGTLYNYLILIASENNIKDPFDPRVVEAYWLGNQLTTRVTTSALVRMLDDELQIRKKLSSPAFADMAQSLVSHGLPTHTDHVLSIFIRTGHNAIAHTLTTMDQCRISWGRVVRTADATVTGQPQCAIQWIVKMRHLEYIGKTLSLGAPVETIVTGMGISLLPGDWVSTHWGYICEKITPIHVRNVAVYTRRALRYAACRV